MLSEIRISNIRNIKTSDLKLSNNINIFVGENGSGKTSILEAVYLLSRSRSFRTQSVSNVRTKGEESLTVFGLIVDKGTNHQVAIKKSKLETRIRINGKNEKKASELIEYLKVHLIRPESQTLFERGSSARRGFIDWGVFHVKHHFLNQSKKYNYVLKQRNKLLKQRDLSTLSSWTDKLVEYGTMVDKNRSGYIQKLQTEFEVTAKALLPDMDIRLEYKKGWAGSLELTDAFATVLNKDVFKGYTSVGPHRSDMVLKVEQHLAQDFLSRGQMKLAVMALYLAQAKLSSDLSGKRICVLIDDLIAELDISNINKVLSLLCDTGAQILITATNLDPFDEWLKLKNTKLFHVEHGCITEGG